MSTVTLQTAESVLKTVYLDTLCDQLNNKTSYFYNKIAKGSEEIAGKEVRCPVRFGINGGMGSASETGNLPISAGNNYVNFTADLKNLYGTIELSDKVIRTSSSSAGALVNVLSAEIEGLLESAKFNFQRMLFQDGSGLLGVTKDTSSHTDLSSLPVANHTNFYEGMVVDLYASAQATDPSFVGLRLTRVDRNDNMSGVVHFTPALPAENGIAANACFYLQQSKDAEIYGLPYLFNSSLSDFYGNNRADMGAIMPATLTKSSAYEMDIMRFLDEIEIKSGSCPNLILTSFGTRRKFVDVIGQTRTNFEYLDITGGYRVLSFNDIPVVLDRFTNSDSMYFVNTDDFKLAQISDWNWMENDKGNILSQLEKRPVYTATLVKYANLICKKPRGQGRINGILF